jgi:hypothetical protein
MGSDEDDWDVVSIPSPVAPLSQWTISKTKPIEGRNRRYKMKTPDGRVEIILCMPMLKIYVKNTGKLVTRQRSRHRLKV